MSSGGRSTGFKSSGGSSGDNGKTDGSESSGKKTKSRNTPTAFRDFADIQRESLEHKEREWKKQKDSKRVVTPTKAQVEPLASHDPKEEHHGDDSYVDSEGAYHEGKNYNPRDFGREPKEPFHPGGAKKDKHSRLSTGI